MELVIDKAGRIVIPKPIRDALRLNAGDVIELERDGETLHLRPRRAGTQIYKKRGIWVHRSNPKNPPRTSLRSLINSGKSASRIL